MSDKNNITFIRPPLFRRKEMTAFFTTRPAEISRKGLAQTIKIPEERVFLPIQKHTSSIHLLRSDHGPATADAVLTEEKNILIGVQVADCVPVLLFDRRKSVIGAVHAGWRGTAEGILGKTLRSMHVHFQSLMSDVLIAIGPSIRGCCYSVDADVNEQVVRSVSRYDFSVRRRGKFFLDLSSINLVQAVNEGVEKGHIWQSDECTFCNPKRFYSYRYEGKTTGRQGGFIVMW